MLTGDNIAEPEPLHEVYAGTLAAESTTTTPRSAG